MIILNDLVASLYSSPGHDATSCFKFSSDNNSLKLNQLELAYRCTIPTAITLDFKSACTPVHQNLQITSHVCEYLEVILAKVIIMDKLACANDNATEAMYNECVKRRERTLGIM